MADDEVDGEVVDGDVYVDEGVLAVESVLLELELEGVCVPDCAKAAIGNVAARAMIARLRM